MTGFDGVAEMTAIDTKLKTLVGGAVVRGLVDAAEHERRLAGAAKPYINHYSSTPIATRGSRTLTDGPRDIPYILPIVIVANGGDPNEVEATGVAIRNLMLGYQPTPNSSPLEVTPGGSNPAIRQPGPPSRWTQASRFNCVINLRPDGA